MYTVPWTVPGPIGTIMGLGFQLLAFVMLAHHLVVDFVLYYPFFRAMTPISALRRPRFPRRSSAKNAEKAASLTTPSRARLTPRALPPALLPSREGLTPPPLPQPRHRGNDHQRPQRQARTRALPGRRHLWPARQCAGQGRAGARHHLDRCRGLWQPRGHAPRLRSGRPGPAGRSYLADLQKDCERVGNKCVACRGKQYIELSQNGDKSLAFVSEQLSKK